MIFFKRKQKKHLERLQEEFDKGNILIPKLPEHIKDYEEFRKLTEENDIIQEKLLQGEIEKEQHGKK